MILKYLFNFFSTFTPGHFFVLYTILMVGFLFINFIHVQSVALSLNNKFDTLHSELASVQDSQLMQTKALNSMQSNLVSQSEFVSQLKVVDTTGTTVLADVGAFFLVSAIIFIFFFGFYKNGVVAQDIINTSILSSNNGVAKAVDESTQAINSLSKAVDESTQATTQAINSLSKAVDESTQATTQAINSLSKAVDESTQAINSLSESVGSTSVEVTQILKLVEEDIPQMFGMHTIQTIEIMEAFSKAQVETPGEIFSARTIRFSEMAFDPDASAVVEVINLFT